MTVVNDSRRWVIVAAVSGFLAVALGAFGAHGLQDRVEPRMLEVWSTAVQYQMFHTLAILGLLALSSHDRFSSVWLSRALWAFALGVLIFSGSLYSLVLSGWRTLGMVTPLGGLAFLAGWLCLVMAALGSSGQSGNEAR